MKRFLFCALLAFATLAQAALYKQVGEDGTVTFTDVAPDADAEALDLPTINSMPPPPVSTSPTAPAASESAQKTYNNLQILAPKQDATLRANNGRIEVEVQVTPALASGHQLQLLLDGEVVASGRQASIVVDDVARGTHRLQASIVDAKGGMQIQSGPVTFHVQRHSILH